MGALTKAKISPMFVIMMGFLVLFMTGIYPDNVMEISGFAGVASLGQYFLLFNMGTSVDILTLKREWRTVLCATVGMAAAILGCAVVIPLIGKEYSMAAAPVVNGGIVATTTMVQACEDLGLDTAAALATFVYAVQKFVGTLPASNCGLSVAKDLVADLRAKHAADPDYSWYKEMAGNSAGDKKALFWEKYKKYYTTFICLAIAAAMMLLASILGDLCQGWVNMSIWCMVLGIICRNTGLVPSNLLRDYAKANGFFSFLSLCTIIPSLVKVDWAQLPVIGFKAVVIFVAVVIFTFIVFYLTPAWNRGQQEPVHRHCHVPADRLSRHGADCHRDHQRRGPDSRGAGRHLLQDSDGVCHLQLYFRDHPLRLHCQLPGQAHGSLRRGTCCFPSFLSASPSWPC